MAPVDSPTAIIWTTIDGEDLGLGISGSAMFLPSEMRSRVYMMALSTTVLPADSRGDDLEGVEDGHAGRDHGAQRAGELRDRDLAHQRPTMTGAFSSNAIEDSGPFLVVRQSRLKQQTNTEV
jgi:hypothetical protein